jgi:hypothetical protein
MVYDCEEQMRATIKAYHRMTISDADAFSRTEVWCAAALVFQRKDWLTEINAAMFCSMHWAVCLPWQIIYYCISKILL